MLREDARETMLGALLITDLSGSTAPRGGLEDTGGLALALLSVVGAVGSGIGFGVGL